MFRQNNIFVPFSERKNNMPVIAYCGIDCERCGNHKKNMNCLGCRCDQDMIADCETRQCCKDKGIGSCAECAEFPCSSLAAFYAEHPKYAYAKENLEKIREQKSREINPNI